MKTSTETFNRVKSIIKLHTSKTAAKRVSKAAAAAAAAAADDMATAQQAARDATGADNGCTHVLPNQANIHS